MTTLEQEILDIINCIICGKYVGQLRVFIEDDEQGCNKCNVPVGRWYYLALSMNQEMSPLVIGKQCESEEEFKEFIEKEFRARGMQRASYWEGFMHLPHWECDENCNCAMNIDTDLII